MAQLLSAADDFRQAAADAPDDIRLVHGIDMDIADAVGEQVDVAALHGFDGDLGLHLVGVARLRQVDDEVDALEPCRRGEGRGRQQGERQNETEQCAE